MLVEPNRTEAELGAPATTTAGVSGCPQGLVHAHIEPRSVYRSYTHVDIECTVLLYCIVSHWGACGDIGAIAYKEAELGTHSSGLEYFCHTTHVTVVCSHLYCFLGRRIWRE